jgi:hypothetical protein
VGAAPLESAFELFSFDAHFFFSLFHYFPHKKYSARKKPQILVSLAHAKLHATFSFSN